MSGKSIGVYIHIPFCGRKCPYCDFYSGRYSLQYTEKYVDAIIRDIEDFPYELTADTVYFGGGTPSLLQGKQIIRILDSVRDKFKLADAEITVEANPCTLTMKKLYEYREAGVNRLSIGVQSFVDKELEFLGRSHNGDKAEKAVYMAKSAGFDNISCDIMIGIPHQTRDSLRVTIDRLCQLPIVHLSSYMLKIEEGTGFDRDSIKVQLPQEETVAEYYILMCEAFESYGFRQYEISNFAKKGFKSRHNLKYWNCEEYIGFGVSAHSFYNGERYCQPSDTESFIRKSLDRVVTDCNAGGTDERIMLGLRLSDGIDTACYPDEADELMKKAKVFEGAGYMKTEGSRIFFTPNGFLLSNSIISELI